MCAVHSGAPGQPRTTVANDDDKGSRTTSLSVRNRCHCVQCACTITLRFQIAESFQKHSIPLDAINQWVSVILRRERSEPRRMIGRGSRAVALRGPLRGHLRVTDHAKQNQIGGDGSKQWRGIARMRSRIARTMATSSVRHYHSDVNTIATPDTLAVWAGLMNGKWSCAYP
jgi:hypothetical protein